MRKITRLVLILGFSFASFAWPQLHLILGKPNTMSPADYAASTAEVHADGSVVIRETLIDPSKHEGLWWFDIDYDTRQAYLLAGRSIGIVLDLDSNQVVKRCKIPLTPGKRGIYEWRIDDANQGSAFVFLRGHGDVNQETLFGLLANPTLTCDESAIPLRNDQIITFVTGGQAGVGGEVAQHLFHVNLVDGRIRTRVGGEPVWFPMQFSPDLIKEFNPVPRNVAAILVRNRAIEAITISYNTPATASFWARERGEGAWLRLPIPPSHSPNIRGFGAFLAWPESVYEEDQEARIKADPRLAPTRAVHANPGEWRKTGSKWGVSTEFVLTHSTTIHPGVLHIFDVKTNRHFQIHTQQSDSEVLLVEDNKVYYRVSDRLYAAEIHGNQLTGQRQIAQSDLVRDAHWAFIPNASSLESSPNRLQR